MSQILCHIRVGKVTLHLYQILAGYTLLARQGIIKLTIETLKKHNSIHLPDNVLEVIINNEIRVLYDLNDGYDNLLTDDQYYVDFMNNLLANCDFYFKRSYSKVYNQTLNHQNKLYPLGLNYMVTTSRNVAHKPLPLEEYKERVKKLVRKIPFTEYYNGKYKTTAFEDIPQKDMNPKILFMARLWDVSGDNLLQDSRKSEERKYINYVRAECIRLCRKEFGDRFFGGVNPTPYSQENYPDIVIDDKNITKRNNYLKKVKESAICISTMGLHESIGWKFAEYVAASKAIVTEKLHYEVPGEFFEGRNYLTFNTPEQCVNQLYTLLENAEQRYQMMVNNFEYYHQNVRPDRLVLNSILTVLNKERVNKNDQNTHSIYANL